LTGVVVFVVAKALELFIAELVQTSAKCAKKSGSKVLDTDHIQEAVKASERFDFLADTVALEDNTEEVVKVEPEKADTEEAPTEVELEEAATEEAPIEAELEKAATEEPEQGVFREAQHDKGDDVYVKENSGEWRRATVWTRQGDQDNRVILHFGDDEYEGITPNHITVDQDGRYWDNDNEEIETKKV